MSKVVDNFLKYIAFDTQSAEDAAAVPSTEKQFALAKLLVEQLKALGLKDVSMSCLLYTSVPYLMSAHPGSTLKEAVELAEHLMDLGYMPEQVQDFYPTPSTISNCLY